MRRLITLVSVFTVVAACGGGEGASTSTTATTADTISTSTTEVIYTIVPPTSSTDVVDTTTTTTTTSTTAGPTGTLPGDVIEFGPAEGDQIAVIGVAYDDSLNLREGPGVDFAVVAEIPPLEDGLVAQGETRDIGTAFWILVDYDGTEGWVNFRFTAHLGTTTDETAAIIDEMSGRPSAETMAELGEIVARHLASEEPPSDIVMVAQPIVGDLGEVIYDVVGLGDDAVAGLRIHVFGQPGDESFELRTVEVTALCGRGVTDDGLCV